MIKRLLLIVALFIGFCLSDQSNAQDSSSINLSHDWKFCPQDRFQENININELNCHDIELPGGWESVIPDYDGYGILYTHFYAPKSFSKYQLGIYLARIRDADKVYINGQLVGETGKFPPAFEKAVFYSRLYAIPLNSIDFESENSLIVWVYNDARPGGVLYESPKIGEYQVLVKTQQNKNYITFALVIILLVFSLTNFINFIFNVKSLENLYFCLFLLAWSGYLYTSNNLVLLTNIPLNIIFRLNIILFFSIFTLFLLFIYQFFRQPLPLAIKIIIAITLTCIPIALISPELKHIYYPIELVEILSIPTVFFAAHLLYKVTKAGVSYSRIMTLVITLYILFGVAEILLDYFFANEATTYSPIGSWVLLQLSLALTFIVGHKNMSYYQRATFDSLTGALRFDRFIDRLERLISRGERDRKPIVILMVDLDDFKQINDKYGHMNGDKVLVIASETMRNELRHFDLLARYGGDEFCISVMMGNVHDIKQMVERVHKAIKSLKLNLNGQEVQISATIGAIIHRPEVPYKSIEALVEKADNLLIQSKAESKGEILW